MSRIDHIGPRTRAAIDDKVMRSGGKKSNYEHLFGTPERAARTLAKISCDGACDSCSLYGARCDYDGTALLEWLLAANQPDSEFNVSISGENTEDIASKGDIDYFVAPGLRSDA